MSETGFENYSVDDLRCAQAWRDWANAEAEQETGEPVGYNDLDNQLSKELERRNAL